MSSPWWLVDLSSPSQYAAWTSISVMGKDLRHMGQSTLLPLTDRSSSGDVDRSCPLSPVSPGSLTMSGSTPSSSFCTRSETPPSELLSNRAGKDQEVRTRRGRVSSPPEGAASPSMSASSSCSSAAGESSPRIMSTSSSSGLLDGS